MVRDDPRDPPERGAVAAAVGSELDWTVTGVDAFDEGLNAVYRVVRAGGDPAVVKTATLASDGELLAEARLQSRLRAETDVPLPAVYATLDPSVGPLGVAAFVMEYCEGRRVTDIRALPAAARERLLVESGRHLAAVHDAPVVDGFGPLRLVEGQLVTRPRYESWADWFPELVDDAVAWLRGDGFAADPEPRFADLAPEVREALLSAPIREWTAEPAVQLADYRPANLVLAADDGADPIVRAVIDVGCAPTADGLLDLALAENALVEVPFGGTERAARLRDVLRTAYRAARDADVSAFDSERYTAYRLCAHVQRLGAFDYWAEFARGDDPDTTATRWRSLARNLLSDLA